MNVLGINYSIDAAASLVRDGEIVAAVTDERFTRRKHSRDFPDASIRYCLSEAGLELDAVDCVAFFWNPGIHLQSLSARRAGLRHHTEYLANLPNHLLAAYPGGWEALDVEYVEQRFALRGERRPLRIVYVTHHEAHAASAFFVSPFEEAAILTVDGYGERTSAWLGEGRDRRVWAHERVEFPHSLGAFYAAITQYLGFRANCDEGKVMGLAAHGEPRFAADLREIVNLLPGGGFELDLTYFGFHQERPRRYSEKFLARFGRDRRGGEPIDQRCMDLAASAQLVLEEALIHLARRLRSLTRQRRLCLAGGVALNCVANSRVIEEAGFDAAFIQPAAGDNGTSLGAALWVQHQLEGAPRRQVMRSDALGPGFDDETIERHLKESRLRYETCEDVAEATAGVLAEGGVVGWFQGRMEFGPRALGQRSILADPRTSDSKARLDAHVKRRETFRPYAPAVLREARQDYFDAPRESPFMLESAAVIPAMRSVIPAVVHADGSARLQTVDRDTHPLFWRLIDAFGRRTGVPVVLNTSFNGRGETMVCDPADALRCFYSTGLDALAIGRFLVRKDA